MARFSSSLAFSRFIFACNSYQKVLAVLFQTLKTTPTTVTFDLTQMHAPWPLNSYNATQLHRLSPLESIMDGDLYDEFGNYVGPELESDESSVEDEAEEHGEDEVHSLLAFKIAHTSWLSLSKDHTFSRS